MGRHIAFTKDYPQIEREVRTDVGVSQPISGHVSLGDDRVYNTVALWDTGATNSVVTPSTAKSLGLLPISVAHVNHAGGTSLANVYLVDIYLPNNVRIQGVRVTECSEKAGEFGVIIGMDVISLGDFTISNANGKTTMSFRIPSMERIDYVNIHNKITPVKAAAEPRRNDLCPCGSGVKYKNCHGKK